MLYCQSLLSIKIYVLLAYSIIFAGMLNNQINQTREIFESPNWAILMRPIWKEYFFEEIAQELKTNEWKEKKNAYVSLVLNLLKQKQVYISKVGVNDDNLRSEIKQIVLHHSHSDGILLEQTNQEIFEWINALQLIRQYGDYFSNLLYNEYNKPIYSGHYLNGEQIFIAYHWLVFPDGEIIQALKDEYLGWHCKGNNFNSIGICLVGDFTDPQIPKPSNKQINSLNKLIAHYKEKYLIQNVSGHRELLLSTTCPGNWFLGENGWKKDI